jgi:hypothetical protein
MTSAGTANNFSEFVAVASAGTANNFLRICRYDLCRNCE